MAKKYKDKRDKKIKDFLTNQQLKQIDDVEKYIDDLIDLHWDKSTICVDINIVNFNKTPSGAAIINSEIIKRRQLYLLSQRYREAGWLFKLDRNENPTLWCLSPPQIDIQNDLI